MLSIRSAKPSHIMVRSWPSDPLATRPAAVERSDEVLGGHPRVGEEHLVEVLVLLAAVMSANGRHTTPRVSVGMISTLMPLCLGASGSVRTNVSRKSASCAPDVHTFWPLTTKWSPSEHRASAQRRQVGSGARLAHAERRGESRRAAPAPPSGASARRMPNEISDAAMMLTPCGLKLW